MTKITNKNASEMECHRWATEASDIGLRPGQWPTQIETTLGNGLPFIAQHAEHAPDGELIAVRYLQANGCIQIRIFND